MDVVEFLGNDELIHGSSEGRDVVAIIDADNTLKVGESVTLIDVAPAPPPLQSDDGAPDRRRTTPPAAQALRTTGSHRRERAFSSQNCATICYRINPPGAIEMARTVWLTLRALYGMETGRAVPFVRRGDLPRRTHSARAKASAASAATAPTRTSNRDLRALIACSAHGGDGVIRRQTTSRVETLEDELERQVLDGRFKPGEHLGEIALAEEFDVGRNTLRAAFDGLVRRGLLVKSRNRGVFVRALTAHDLGEIYEVRTALEVQASRMLAARAHGARRSAELRSRSTTASVRVRRSAWSSRRISPSTAPSSSGPGMPA